MKYECQVDLSNKNMSQTLTVDMVGGNKEVLEFGCAAGAVSKALRDRACTVVGVELDRELASAAKEFCEDVIVGDAEELDLESILGERTFDVVIFGDVLEHLRDPLRMLRRVPSWLNPEGYVVASIPNITHGAVRLSLLRGRFQYTEEGLLDESHLRFFSFDTMCDMFEQAGFAVAETRRTSLGLFETEIALRPEDFPPELIAEIESDPDSTTYQFVVKAVRHNGDAAIGALHRREQEQRKRMFALEREVAERDQQIEGLRGEIASAAEELEARRAEIEQLRVELASATIALTAAQDALSHHEAHWAQVEQRRTYRLYRRLKRFLSPT